MFDQEQALVFTVGPVVRGEGSVVSVAQIDSSASLFRDARRQRDLDTRGLYPILKGSRAFDVGRVRQHRPGQFFKPLPLFYEVVAHVVADPFDIPPVSHADLSNVGRVDDDLAAIGNDRLGFVHRFGRRPEVVVALRGHDSTLRKGLGL